MNTRPAIIKAYALGVITGAFLTAGIVFIAPAKADNGEPSPAVIKAAISDEPFICRELIIDSSVNSLMAILTAVMNVEHLTPYESGWVVGLAVNDGCAHFKPVLDRFVAIYGASSTTAAT